MQSFVPRSVYFILSMKLDCVVTHSMKTGQNNWIKNTFFNWQTMGYKLHIWHLVFTNAVSWTILVSYVIPVPLLLMCLIYLSFPCWFPLLMSWAVSPNFTSKKFCCPHSVFLWYNSVEILQYCIEMSTYFFFSNLAHTILHLPFDMNELFQFYNLNN